MQTLEERIKGRTREKEIERLTSYYANAKKILFDYAQKHPELVLKVNAWYIDGKEEEKVMGMRADVADIILEMEM